MFFCQYQHFFSVVNAYLIEINPVISLSSVERKEDFTTRVKFIVQYALSHEIIPLKACWMWFLDFFLEIPGSFQEKWLTGSQKPELSKHFKNLYFEAFKANFSNFINRVGFPRFPGMYSANDSVPPV